MPTLISTNKPTYTTKQPDNQGRNRRRYNTGSSVWRRIRARQLAEQPLCVDCSTEANPVPANTVDHIDGNAYNNSSGNLQSMCHQCHSRKTAREDGGFGNMKRNQPGK